MDTVPITCQHDMNMWKYKIDSAQSLFPFTPIINYVNGQTDNQEWKTRPYGPGES